MRWQWRRENRWDDRRQRHHWRVLAESTTTIWGRRRHRLVSNIRGSGRIVVVLLSMRDHRARVGGGRGCGSGGVGLIVGGFVRLLSFLWCVEPS